MINSIGVSDSTKKLTFGLTSYKDIKSVVSFGMKNNSKDKYFNNNKEHSIHSRSGSRGSAKDKKIKNKNKLKLDDDQYLNHTDR